MKTIRGHRLLLVVFLLVSVGCGDSDDGGYGELEAETDQGIVEQSYENGHPLTYSNDQPATLEREAELVRLVNEYRISYGLNALILDADMSDLARAHSKHMAEENFFHHDNPEGDKPWERALRAGFSFDGLGENIGIYQPLPEDVFRGWVESPIHRDILLDPDWTHVGTGYYYDATSDEEHFWTQVYLR